MMKQIDLMFRTMVAELQQRIFDAQRSADFPLTGRFVSVKVDNRSYWYFDQPDGKGGQTGDMSVLPMITRSQPGLKPSGEKRTIIGTGEKWCRH